MAEFKINPTVIRANATRATGVKRSLNTQSYEVSRISSRMIERSIITRKSILNNLKEDCRILHSRMVNTVDIRDHLVRTGRTSEIL